MEKINGWLKVNDDLKKKIFDFNDGYISFLNEVKTERETVNYLVNELDNNGFVNVDSVNQLKFGDKVYYNNRGKSVYAAVIGKKDILKGINVVGSHVDSPRLDLKPNPLYEDGGQALFKTHYYGGIKKYQWTTIPLSIRGVIVKTNGNVVNINIGEAENDPIFTITDLLPHLAIEQEKKKLNDAIGGEALNVLIGNIASDKESEGIKRNVLKILKDKYEILEDDFISAELEIVPAFKAKSMGFDKSMVAGYGQDDRVCCYNNLKALLSVSKPLTTAVSIFADKEEIGSLGNTGMESISFDNFMMQILEKLDKAPVYLTKMFCNSRMLSADVGAALDPTYKDVNELNNTSYLGHGVELSKYSGGNGKSGASDANAEFIAEIRDILEKHNIIYQMSELGKVDLGSGGTIAYILANKGMDVIDCGVPILSMHSPYEVSSKLDNYMAYLTYKYFFDI